MRRATAGLTRKAISLSAAALVAGLLGAGLTPTSLRADAIDDVLAKFATDRFPDTEKGIQDLAASGIATGPAMLDALAANQLFFDPSTKGVYFKDSSGAHIAAKSGAAAEGVTEARLKKVRLNNSVRAAMQTAQGALTLMSPDPAKRRSAAETVFKSRNPASLPLVQTALAAEKDPKIRLAFEHARAAIIASDKNHDEIKRLEALDVIKERGDQDAASLLSSIAAGNDGRVKASAEEGAKAIQTRLALWAHVQNIWYGLSLGSVLLLAAIGFVPGLVLSLGLYDPLGLRRPHLCQRHHGNLFHRRQQTLPVRSLKSRRRHHGSGVRSLLWNENLLPPRRLSYRPQPQRGRAPRLSLLPRKMQSRGQDLQRLRIQGQAGPGQHSLARCSALYRRIS
jgi:hypothetical protein